jgi:superfamily II DNA or RNA helicase
MLLNLPIDKVLIGRRLSFVTLTKGEKIVASGKVLEANVDQLSITGIVQGTQFAPYRQNIILTDDKKVIGMTYCTCPVGNDCKHVAAVLLKLAADKAEIERRCKEQEEMASAYTPGYDVTMWVTAVMDAAGPLPNDYPSNTEQRARYILTLRDGDVILKLVTVRILKNGRFGDQQLFKMPWMEGSFPRSVLEVDRPLLQTIHRVCHRDYKSFGTPQYQISGLQGAYLLRRLIDTGRLHWMDHDEPLQLGPSREMRPVWLDEDGTQRLQIEVEGGGAILPLSPLWFVDLEQNLIGETVSAIPQSVALAMLKAPAIAPQDANYVHQRLREALPDFPEAVPRDHEPPEVRVVAPVPSLHLFNVEGERLTASYNRRKATITAARLSFVYENMQVRSTSAQKELKLKKGEKVIVYRRNSSLEGQFERRLTSFGWSQFHYRVDLPSGHGNDFVLDPEKSKASDPVIEFVFKGAEELKREGWKVKIDPDVASEVLPEPVWELSLDEASGIDWFSIQLGAKVGTEQIDLAPVLARIVANMRSYGKSPLSALDKAGETIMVRMEDGRILPLPVDRVKPLLSALMQLYGDPSEWGELKKLPKWRLLDFQLIEESTKGLSWSGSAKLKSIAAQLATFEKIGSATEPPSFSGTLRDYQKSGVAWLQFLSEFGFGGILADDMGLGKTIQTLAHLLWEKEKGRAELPSLLIAPTSTLPNWTSEVAKFAPGLKVCLLHGSDRKKRLKEIDSSALVITTYSLLARDKEELLKHNFHLLVLDEAQNVKNPKVAAAYVSRQIHANQKFCLSGTPIENHLGELWSLFEIVMPGMLGNEDQFKKRFRVPIEKMSDKKAHEELSRRIKPFLLRRTKSQVASELPPKTEIVETVEFDAAQRDLYETVRSAMDKRVRDALSTQGMSRSHIVILDALLKLRQVCCDPRLLKVEAARDLKESAKLERLMEMIPEMIEEGRRILLFSQFTSMLDLIETSLTERGLEYVKITGETKDRATPVKRFQAREIPLFLISLKAGGTGLNLTAADTVIHYDPWWNPAVERQATDRAHRIGQDQPVFVYKLISKDTVEEKIVELQARKGALADALMDPAAQKLDVTKEDLEFIFGR